MFLFDKLVIVFDGSLIAGFAAAFTAVMYAHELYLKHADKKSHKRHTLQLMESKHRFIKQEFVFRNDMNVRLMVNSMFGKTSDDKNSAETLSNITANQLSNFLKNEYDTINTLRISIGEEPVDISDMIDQLYDSAADETSIDDKEEG